MLISNLTFSAIQVKLETGRIGSQLHRIQTLMRFSERRWLIVVLPIHLLMIYIKYVRKK